MEIEELEAIVDGLAPSSMILTRSNLKTLRKILLFRSEGKFEYGPFHVIKTELEDLNEWEYIQMNDYIKSPQYWGESDFKELRN